MNFQAPITLIKVTPAVSYTDKFSGEARTITNAFIEDEDGEVMEIGVESSLHSRLLGSKNVKGDAVLSIGVTDGGRAFAGRAFVEIAAFKEA